MGGLLQSGFQTNLLGGTGQEGVPKKPKVSVKGCKRKKGSFGRPKLNCGNSRKSNWLDEKLSDVWLEHNLEQPQKTQRVSL